MNTKILSLFLVEIAPFLKVMSEEQTRAITADKTTRQPSGERLSPRAQLAGTVSMHGILCCRQECLAS